MNLIMMTMTIVVVFWRIQDQNYLSKFIMWNCCVELHHELHWMYCMVFADIAWWFLLKLGIK